MLTLIVAALYAFVVLFDFLPGRKEYAKKTAVLYCALLAVSFGVLLLFSLGIQVPGPSEPIRSFIDRFIGPQS